MVICLELSADLHMVQLMPLPLTASWYSKIQIGFTFLVPFWYPGSHGQRAVKRACVCVCVYVCWVSLECDDPSAVSVHTTHSQRLLLVVVYVTFRATYSTLVTFTIFTLLTGHANRSYRGTHTHTHTHRLAAWSSG